MQSRTGTPREGLTVEQVETLITGDSMTFSAGLEEVDADGLVVRDLSSRLLGGSISYNNYATIHSSCRLDITEPLDWGAIRVRPFVTLKNHDTEARFDLGVYRLSTPERPAGTSPRIFDVEGYGLLSILNSPAAQTYRVAAGTNVVTAVRDLLTEHGAGTPFYIESSDETLTSDRVYPLDESTTWLNIANDLLGQIGYRGLWEDWRGRFRSEPYRSPTTRGSEWTYTDDERTTILHEDRFLTADFYQAPNRWVFIRNDPSSGVSEPGTGDVYEVTNQSDGPTSIDARGGVTITAVHMLDATSTEALQARGDEIVERDQNIDATFRLTTDPNPLHWHFDVVTVNDTGLGVGTKTVSHEWSLDLSEGSMTHVLRKV